MSRSNKETQFYELVTEIEQYIHFSYEGLSNFFNAAYEMAISLNAQIGEKIETWNNQKPNHKLSGFEVYENDFLRLLNYESEINFAIIIIAHSKLEVCLKSIFKTLGLKKKGFPYLINYFKTKPELDITSIKEDWNKIEIYKILRNIIAHENGQLDIQETKLLTENINYKKLISLTDCKISSNGLISISKNTTKEFIKLSESVLYKTCDLLREMENTKPTIHNAKIIV